MALFLGLYKMFLVLEMEILRSHKPRPQTGFVVLVGAAFAIYAAVDSSASYNRQVHLDSSEVQALTILQTDILAGCLHCVYSVIILIYTVAAFLENDGANTIRLGYFAFSVVLTVILSLFSGVFCVYANFWMYTVKPPLLMKSILETLTALTLFLLHTGGDPEYEGLDKTKETAQVIEIDQISPEGAAARNESDTEE
jgi:hypothetical protein